MPGTRLSAPDPTSRAASPRGARVSRSLLLSAGVHAGLLAVAAVGLASVVVSGTDRTVSAVFTDVSVPELDEQRPAPPETPDVERVPEDIDLLVESVEPQLATVDLTYSGEPNTEFAPQRTGLAIEDATIAMRPDAAAASAPAVLPAAPVAAVVPAPCAVDASPLAANAHPAYPALARRRGWSGAVVLDIDVSADGSVSDVRVAESSGRDLLDRVARETALGWRYRPAESGGVAVATTVTRTVRFELR